MAINTPTVTVWKWNENHSIYFKLVLSMTVLQHKQEEHRNGKRADVMFMFCMKLSEILGLQPATPAQFDAAKVNTSFLKDKTVKLCTPTIAVTPTSCIQPP